MVRDQRGFTFIELMIVVSVIGLLTAVAIPLYANTQAQARLAKARSDVAAIGSAVSVYATQVGTPPTSIAQLTAAAVDLGGNPVGPWFGVTPASPVGWSAYRLVTVGGVVWTCTTNTSDTGNATTKVGFPDNSRC